MSEAWKERPERDGKRCDWGNAAPGSPIKSESGPFHIFNMSQTASQQCLTPTFTFDEQSYRHYAHWFQEGFITIGILGPLYGM